MATLIEHESRAAKQDALERARTVGRLLDEAVGVPGVPFRVGIDPILGVVPVSGDFVAALCSLYIVFEGIRAGVSKRKVAVMLALVGVEFVIGSVPVLGTLVDAVWKVNTRNVEVIESAVEASS